MPAVKAFSINATLNFVLQITVFVTVMTLDLKGILESGIDLVCCFNANSDIVNSSKLPFLQRTLAKYYTTFLLKPLNRKVVMLTLNQVSKSNELISILSLIHI